MSTKLRKTIDLFVYFIQYRSANDGIRIRHLPFAEIFQTAKAKKYSAERTGFSARILFPQSHNSDIFNFLQICYAPSSSVGDGPTTWSAL